MTRLYSIGDVHDMTGLSVSALRYYADMKVVCPVRIDRQTGYRYYDFDDIQRLKTVGYLKKAGFTLAEITVVMEAASEEERRLLLSERMEQTQKQIFRKCAVIYWKKQHLWREKSWPLKAALSQAEIVFLLRRTSLSCRRAIISV